MTLGVLIIAELFFFPSLENIFASCMLLAGWLILTSLVLTQRNLHEFPVSFVMVLGYSVFAFLLPLPFTLMEFKPVTYNLRIPLETFSHHAIFALAIALAHLLYTLLLKQSNPFRSVLSKTNFYASASDREIWISALIGLMASYYNYVVAGGWQNDVADRDIIYYIATIFSQFIWMPILLFFPKLRNRSLSRLHHQLPALLIYILFVCLVAVISNWRTTLYSGLFIAMGLFFLSFLYGYADLKSQLKPARIIILASATVFLSGPLMDFSYAMVAVRGERTNMSAMDFLAETLNVYADENAMLRTKKLYRSEGQSPTVQYTWDEEYLNGAIGNRMVNLKISDNCLFYAEQIGYANAYMQDELIRQVSAFVPNVALRLFGLDGDEKIEIGGYSIGDYLYSLAIGSTSQLGSAVISSMPGVGMAFFGYWYILVIVPMFAIIFLMMDSFAIRINGRVHFSYMFFVMFVPILNWFNDRHVYVYEFRWILRTYFEGVVVFICAMSLVRLAAISFAKTEIDGRIG